MDRHPDASPCILIAADILHTFTKFQPWHLATPCTLPCISVYETSPKTIKNLRSQIVGKVVGYYLYFHIKWMAHMSDGTATCHL